MLELWVTWMLIYKEYGGLWNRLRRLVETDRYSGGHFHRSPFTGKRPANSPCVSQAGTH